MENAMGEKIPSIHTRNIMKALNILKGSKCSLAQNSIHLLSICNCEPEFCSVVNSGTQCLESVEPSVNLNKSISSMWAQLWLSKAQGLSFLFLKKKLITICYIYTSNAMRWEYNNCGLWVMAFQPKCQAAFKRSVLPCILFHFKI